MKFMVASDLHGSLFYTRQLLDCFNREGADKLILLGDLYYHGPRNPFPQDYNPKEVAGLLNAIKDRLVVIMGNCDSEVDMMISEFKFRKSYCLKCGDFAENANGKPDEDSDGKTNNINKEKISGKTFIFTHGHKINMSSPPEKPFDVLLYGHEHTGYIKQSGSKIFVNTGSVSLPKGGTPHSYVVIQPPQIILKDLGGTEISKISF